MENEDSSKFDNFGARAGAACCNGVKLVAKFWKAHLTRQVARETLCKLNLDLHLNEAHLLFDIGSIYDPKMLKSGLAAFE